MSRVIDLRGKRTRIRTVVEQDRSALIAIRSTPEVARRWRGDDLDAEFDENLQDEETARCAIEDIDGRVVGLIQFSEEEDPDYRHASIDIYVDPAHHRKGLASDAIRTLADHLFDSLGHHRLVIDPAADNLGAIECYRAVGFRPVGVMRSYERQADGSWADGLLMDMLAGDRTR